MPDLIIYKAPSRFLTCRLKRKFLNDLIKLFHSFGRNCFKFNSLIWNNDKWGWMIFHFSIDIHFIFLNWNSLYFFDFSDIVITYYVYYYYYYCCIFSPRMQWMDYRCRLGSLGNSYTASGRSDPGEAVGPSYILGRQDFFFLSCRFTSFLTRSSLFTFFVCLSYFHFILEVLMR